ncbi:piggyBac transposable element-derived protein 4-like [Xyrichtys novacula]|uniref:PiggyBac transposable element-derived protein 4-like n=1 Tax=Xyrichtys novacula TaxID=13765 RepID=A0AAV1GMH4_XYRNO|nr:piggyBac transposable element-derived protein 4-like [Xyrichtys novacula]
MEKKTFDTKRDFAEILAEIQRGSDVEFEDSSDSESGNDAGSEEEALFMSDLDPVYDHQEEESQEQAGPSGVFTPPTIPAAVTPPPPLPARVSPLETSEEEEEGKEFVPPQHRSSSSSGSWPSSPEPMRARGRGRGRQASKRPRPAPIHPEAQLERWHTKEEPDVEPPTPRFEPKNPPGPRIDTTVQWSPLSLFRLFFSSSTINTIINNTNANAARRLAQGAKYKWSPLSGDSFYLFLSIVLFFGLVSVDSRNDYWGRDWPYQFVFPKCSMTRDKFEAIFWSLHLSDVAEDEENERKRGTPQFDRLFKIKPLYGEIVNACNSLFQPNQSITIDERMVASKARIGFRQYMRDKPTKFGYKLFVLADSKTGFTSNFFVYQGKGDTKVKQRGQTEDGLSVTSVMNLMKFDLLGKGYHLYVDNFYTSPRLFSKLLQNHTVACGTIRSNREGFPRTTVNDLPKKPERGDMRWIRKGNLLFARWMDTKIVNICSTFHKAYSGATVQRTVKGPDGRWHRGPVDVPDACRDYNINMGGVDLSDALIQYDTVHSKTMRWYKTFFYHFVDIAVVNSFILHKAVATCQNQTPMSLKRFREVLMKEMVEQAQPVTAAASPGPSGTNTCMPVFRGGDGTQQRRKCVVCAAKAKEKAKQVQGYKAKDMKTPVFCSRCNVSLCLVPGRNCFVEYHKK